MTVGRAVSTVAGALLLAMVMHPVVAWEASFGPTVGPEKDPRLYDGRTIDEWRAVIKSLELTSSAATEAVPGLIAICRDPAAPQQTRAQAAYTLGRIGAPARAAVPALEKLLKPPGGSDDPSTARWAAKALSLFGPDAAPATPALVKLSADTDRHILERLASLEALGRIGGAHPDAIPTLIQLSSASDRAPNAEFAARQVQAAAIDSLAFAGPAASAAVLSLIQLTREASPDLRKRAAAALGAIGPAAGIAAGTLVDLVLFDESPEVRDAATASLARIGDAGENALQQLLSDEDAAVRSRAASGLGEIERLADSSRQALVAALDDADLDVRLSAVQSLRQANHDPEPLIPVLLAALTDEERQPRIRAYRLVIEMRSHAKTLLPRLQVLTDDPRPHVRQVAKKVIEQLGEPETVK